jgi:hypothetical protein
MSIRRHGKPTAGVGIAAVAILCLSQALADGPVVREGVEYRLTPPMGGDQVFPALALGTGGGYLVWQDNRTDGHGLGISARRVDANLNATFGTFRVNEIAAGDQEHAAVAILKDGGAVFVWQGGSIGMQNIYARFLRADGTFASGDVQVNSYLKDGRQHPAVAVLDNGNVVIVWSSYGQDGSQYGVYGQLLSPVGARLGGEFLVPQSTLNNQRTPSVVSLPDGGFYVAWVSERYRGLVMQADSGGTSTESGGGTLEYDVQVVGRRFSSTAAPAGGEQALSSAARIAANPALSVASDGRMLVAWSSLLGNLPPNSPRVRERWDIFARPLAADGSPIASEFVVNAHLPGDQYLPRVAAIREHFMVVWTSLAQDGSREGVFGRAVALTGPTGPEVQVNTFAMSQQIHPVIASLEDRDALVVWSSYVGGVYSFELLGQRFSAAPELAAPAAPFVTPLSQSRLLVTWAPLEGLGIAAYQLYVDGAATPIERTSNRFYLEKLAPGSIHTFSLAYRLDDGRISPLSAPAEGATWGEDGDFSGTPIRYPDGLPDDWQRKYWGEGLWPGPAEDSDGDGATNLQEFLAGTDPMDPTSVLRVAMQSDDQGARLVWNTQPGGIYQIQISSDLSGWVPLTDERFAAGTTDSILVDGNQGLLMYRVIRIR